MNFPFIINWTYMLVSFYSGEYTIINSINYLFSFFIVLLTFLLETPYAYNFALINVFYYIQIGRHASVMLLNKCSDCWMEDWKGRG